MPKVKPEDRRPMGRPKVDDAVRARPINITLRKQLLDRLDRVAEDMRSNEARLMGRQVTRSTLITFLVQSGLEDLYAGFGGQHARSG